MKNYTSKVYQIIKELVEEYEEKGQVKYLCKLADVSRSGYYNYFSEKSDSLKKTAKEAANAASSETTDKYSKYKSSWLDNQLGQYDKDANKTTAADPSVSVDTTI